MITCWAVIFVDKHCYMPIVTFFLYKDDHHVDAIVLMISTWVQSFGWSSTTRYKKGFFFSHSSGSLVTALAFVLLRKPRNTKRDTLWFRVTMSGGGIVFCGDAHRYQIRKFVSFFDLLSWHGKKKEIERKGRTGYIEASSWRHTNTYADKWCGIVQP